jgi:hypothetical protein
MTNSIKKKKTLKVSLYSGGWFVKSFINAVQAHFMILKDSLELKNFFFLFALLKIQNGGEILDGHQTITCHRFVKNNANNLQLRILE